MANLEKGQLTLPNLVREYPSLEEWFVNPNNIAAQLQGDSRLKSAEEKLALAGGETQVENNLSVVPGDWQNPYVVLLACRQEPMVPYEIIRFGKIVGKDMGLGVFVTIKGLTKYDELRRVEGLTYVQRLKNNPNIFHISLNEMGYKTTENGLRIAARNLAPTEQRVGGLVPVPTAG